RSAAHRVPPLPWRCPGNSPWANGAPRRAQYRSQKAQPAKMLGRAVATKSAERSKDVRCAWRNAARDGDPLTAGITGGGLDIARARMARVPARVDASRAGREPWRVA